MRGVIRTSEGSGLVNSYMSHTIRDAKNVRTTTLYGPGGSGFGAMSFTLDRDPNLDYDDIGYGYEITFTKHLRTFLFHGHIVDISGSVSDGVGSIKVAALGEVSVSDDDEVWFVFSDTRLEKWVTPGETPSGNYRPDLFSTGASEYALFINPNSDVEIEADQYTALKYTFVLGETAERLTCTLASSLGSGVLFDGTVDSIDEANGRVNYIDLASGEDNVYAGMVLHNITKGDEFKIVDIDRTSDWIEASSPSLLNGWGSGDEITVYGPPFRAAVSSISGDTIVYTGEVGESNLADAFPLVNITKSALAEISSYDTVADEIVLSDELMISGWEEGDEIATGYPLFVATLNGAPSGTTVNYSPESGERLVALDTGWTLHNWDRDEVATVQSWNAGSDQLTVTASGDVSAWANGETIHIYAPIRFSIVDGNDNVLWNSTDERMGDVPTFFESVDANTSGSPDSISITATVLIDGSFGTMSIVQASDVSIRSYTDNITTSLIAAHVLGILDDWYHKLSSDGSEIETAYDKTIDAGAYFERQETPRAVMSWAVGFGNTNGRDMAWGVRLDNSRKFFLETQPPWTVSSTKWGISYIVRGAKKLNADAGGKTQGTAQQVRAVYQDAMGQQQFTAWQSDTDAYFGGYAIRHTIRLDGTYTDADAVAMAQLYLANNSAPKVSSRFRVSDGAVFTPLGILVPVDELVATGHNAIVKNWTLADADAQSGAGIARQVIEQIVGVDIDHDNLTATLTPASPVDTFEKLVGDIAKIRDK